ncbi:MAG: L,D-transpeptidase family protein [Bdellovibrionales bacterium]|nr:L,D-transpeptidase family protein [Bdellovibrionales bacterium]
MSFRTVKQLLIAGTTVLAFHFATVSLCFATESTKTDQKSDPVAIPPPQGMLPTALLGLNSETGVFSKYAFVVDKKNRTLTVWQTDSDKLKLMGAWPTDIGERDGDKLVQGDRRTPEGVYFFQEEMDGRKTNYDLYGEQIFTLDYPNYFDRLDKKTGNGIWLHAIPETKSLLRGSRGCVVVRNEVVKELAKYIELNKTPIVIAKEIEYVDAAKWQATREQIGAWLESWRTAWMGKDLDAYMSQYSERFKSQGMNKERWKTYKKTLADRYKYIEVALKDVQIFNQGPRVVFRFLQDYKSDRKQDFGAKTIYVLKNGNTWEIVGETWNGLKSPSAAPVETAPIATTPSKRPSASNNGLPSGTPVARPASVSSQEENLPNLEW